MKRLTTILFVALMMAFATPLILAEAREYKGPEHGKMGWVPAHETKIEAAAPGGLRFEAAGPHKYIGPERGKMGWGAQVVELREVKPAEK